jgi:hypothetical protein
MQIESLKVGDEVVMHTCIEAKNQKYHGMVWKVTSSPWMLCGSEVVMLEGFSGGFATQYLQKIRVNPIAKVTREQISIAAEALKAIIENSDDPGAIDCAEDALEKIRDKTKTPDESSEV